MAVEVLDEADEALVAHPDDPELQNALRNLTRPDREVVAAGRGA